MVLATHAAPAHMHGETLRAILDASPKAKLVLPKSTAETAFALGVPYHRMTTTDSGLRVEYFKNGMYARIYAVPSANPELDATPLGGYPYLGYLIRCGDTTIYHAGACRTYETLADRLRPYNVTVAILPVAEANFSVEEAAEHLTVATQLDPTHVASHLALGRALVSLGKKEEAKPVLKAGIDAAVSGRSNGGVDLVPELQQLLRTLG
jgi:L-ascorbate metabolism protein UlaG (beta-lactamase superfamily)